MEKNNHNNQNASKQQDAPHDEVKKTDDQIKKPETNEPVQKQTASHTK